MDIYEIKWKGPFSVEDAKSQTPADTGVYLWYEIPNKSDKALMYVGQSRDLTMRLRTHNYDIARSHTREGMTRLQVYVGDIYPLEGSHSADIGQVRDIESFLIYHLKPHSASQEFITEVRNKRILLINTGNTEELPSIMCHNEDFLNLIRQNLTSKPISRPKLKVKKTTHRKQSSSSKVSMHLGPRD